MTARLPIAQVANALPLGSRVGKASIGAPLWRLGDVVIYEATHPQWGNIWVHEFWPHPRAARTAGGLVAALPEWAVGLERDLAAYIHRARIWTALPETPNLSKGLAVVEQGGTAYVLARAADGRPLGEWLEGAGRVDADFLELVSRQLGSGLAVLHQAGTEHADLSPAGIFVDTAKKPPELVIVGPGAPAADVPPDGFAPLERHEHPESHRAAAAGDIYSACAILYELAVGEPLLPARQRLYRSQPAAAVVNQGADAPAWLFEQIDAGLNLEPGKRPLALIPAARSSPSARRKKSVRRTSGAEATPPPARARRTAAAVPGSSKPARKIKRPPDSPPIVAEAAPSSAPQSPALRAPATKVVAPPADEPVVPPPEGHTGQSLSEPGSGLRASGEQAVTTDRRGRAIRPIWLLFLLPFAAALGAAGVLLLRPPPEVASGALPQNPATTDSSSSGPVSAGDATPRTPEARASKAPTPDVRPPTLAVQPACKPKVKVTCGPSTYEDFERPVDTRKFSEIFLPVAQDAAPSTALAYAKAADDCIDRGGTSIENVTVNPVVCDSNACFARVGFICKTRRTLVERRRVDPGCETEVLKACPGQ